MPEFTDEYFINLIMDYDKRDDTIYPKWAVWCAQSNDRYYIDGANHHFFTHIRTDEEIAEERKKREIMEFMISQRPEIDKIPEDWVEYEMYIQDNINTAFMQDISPLSYEEWKVLPKDSEEESEVEVEQE